MRYVNYLKYYEFKKLLKYFSGNDDVVEKTNNDLKR